MAYGLLCSRDLPDLAWAQNRLPIAYIPGRQDNCSLIAFIVTVSTLLLVMQVQERFDVDITILPDHIDKELYRHDE